jgi:hypothetical protein
MLLDEVYSRARQKSEDPGVVLADDPSDIEGGIAYPDYSDDVDAPSSEPSPARKKRRKKKPAGEASTAGSVSAGGDTEEEA